VTTPNLWPAAVVQLLIDFPLRARCRSRGVIAVAIVLMSAATAGGEWVIVQPPTMGQRDCELVYDRSAPISAWWVAWFGAEAITSHAAETSQGSFAHVWPEHRRLDGGKMHRAHRHTVMANQGCWRLDGSEPSGPGLVQHVQRAVPEAQGQ
jgi:hypothetical protein